MQSLIDKDAIRELVLSYSRAVDRQDFVLLRSLYADDAIEDDHVGLYEGPADGYVAWLQEVMPRLGVTAHNVTNHLIGFDAADRAQGEVYVVAYHRLPAEGGGWEDLVYGMRYLDHYARGADGRWRFARRTVTLDWKQAGPSCWDLTAPDIAPSLRGTHGPTDSSYRVLSHALFTRRG